jgi:dipeptidyl aminopeptidase/acylaminoacyl peptidase
MSHLFPIERYLNVRAASSPSFSPDGRFVAYLSNTTGIPQAWLTPTTGGEPVQLTFGNDAVREVHFSPIRQDLLFSMDAGGNERTQLYRLFGVGDTEHGIGDGWDFENLSNQPNAIHSFGGWSNDGTRIAFSANRDDPSRFDIYVQEVATGAKISPVPKLLATGPGGYYSAVAWSPNDKFILVERTDSNVNQDLYIIEVATGKTRHLTPHDGDAQFQSAVWSHDGRKVYCVSTFQGRDLTQLAEIDAESGTVRFPHETMWEVERVDVSSKGKYLLQFQNVDGLSRLRLRSPESIDSYEELAIPVGVVSAAEFARDEKSVAIAHDGPRHNSDIWIIDLTAHSDSNRRQLTHSGRAGLPFSEFVEPELIHYKTFDDRMIPSWWFQAQTNTAAPGPVIVYPHGGPESQTRPNFTGLFQYFLARGYSILAPNVRGSSGYGTAFMNLDNTTKRMDSVADLAHAAYWLRDQKKGDPKRIAVYGGSYGGFMVLAAVTHYPELWAAGIDVVGICNFVTFLEQTGEWRRAHREKEYGKLREHRDFLVSISPIHHADKIRCPLMVIHGANDPRVPVGEAEQIVAVLKNRGVPVEYLRYEDEGHGLVKLKNRLDAYPKMAAFLDRYLKP